MTGQSPHDALFKRFLSRPEQARAQLRAVLPAGVGAGLVWEQLRLVPGSFVDADLRWRHTDLLFAVPAAGDREALIYVVVEHQSSPDPVMPLRMLRYLVRIWDRHLTQSGGDRLPPIFPVVLSHGPRWRAPTSLAEMIDADAEVAAAFAQLLQFRFVLDDLAASDLRALQGRALPEQALVALALLQDSARPQRRVAEVLLELQSELTGFDQADLVSVWMYVQLTTDIPPLELYRLAEQLGPTIQEAYMSTAEALRTEGRMAGRAEGRAETLLQQIAHKFGPLDPAAAQRVRDASPSELTDWTGRILTATTLHELLGRESR